MEIIEALLIWLASCMPFFIPLIVPVGSYGFYKHAARHTDGTDDIQNATSGQKGLMTSTYGGRVDKLVNIAVTPTVVQWGALGALVEWTDWTPTLTGGADLSGYDTAKYYRIGNICFIQFIAGNRDVTTAGGTIQITLPFTAADTDDISINNHVHDGTNWIGQSHAWIAKNTAILYVSKTAGAGGWAGTESGVYIRINTFFEIA